jgi:hypothetical protein
VDPQVRRTIRYRISHKNTKHKEIGLYKLFQGIKNISHKMKVSQKVMAQVNRRSYQEVRCQSGGTEHDIATLLSTFLNPVKFRKSMFPSTMLS